MYFFGNFGFGGSAVKTRCNGDEGGLAYELFFGKGQEKTKFKNFGCDLFSIIMIVMMMILVMLMIDMIILGFGGSSISWQLQLKT